MFVFFHFDYYVRVSAITIEQVIQSFKMLLDVRPQRGRYLDMSACIFKFHKITTPFLILDFRFWILDSSEIVN